MRRHIRNRDRRGPRVAFTLAEVVVTMAILVIIAAVALPNLAGYYNVRRATETRAILKSLSLSLNNQNVMSQNRGFFQVIGTTGKYPFKLSHLAVQIKTADKQCGGSGGTAYLVADSSSWVAAGPFTDLNIIPDKGVPTPLGWIHDSVVKGTTAAGTAGWVEVHIDSLQRADVRALDSLIDNAVDSLTGLFRFVNTSGQAPPSQLRLTRFLVAASPVTASGVQVGCVP